MRPFISIRPEQYSQLFNFGLICRMVTDVLCSPSENNDGDLFLVFTDTPVQLEVHNASPLKNNLTQKHIIVLFLLNGIIHSSDGSVFAQQELTLNEYMLNRDYPRRCFDPDPFSGMTWFMPSASLGEYSASSL